MAALTILPVQTRPSGPYAPGLRSWHTQGRTGQVPAGGAIPASACKGRREANEMGGGGGCVKGNAEARALGGEKAWRGCK